MAEISKSLCIERSKEAASNVLHESADAFQQSGSGLGVRPVRTTVRLPIKRPAKTQGVSVAKRRRLVKSDIFSSLKNEAIFGSKFCG